VEVAVATIAGEVAVTVGSKATASAVAVGKLRVSVTPPCPEGLAEVGTCASATTVSVKATVEGSLDASAWTSAFPLIAAVEYFTIMVEVGFTTAGGFLMLWTTKTIRNPTRRRRKKAYLPKSYRQIERGGRLCAMRYSPLVSGFEDGATVADWAWESTSVRFAPVTFTFCPDFCVLLLRTGLLGRRPAQSMTHSITRPTTIPASNPKMN
jgi:hypothetical protein